MIYHDDMEEQDIHKLFMSVLEDDSQNTSAVRGIFSTLIKSTLKYRDHIQESEGFVVTVEDVHAVLEWLPSSLESGRLPVTDDKIRLGLLELWLEELKL